MFIAIPKGVFDIWPMAAEAWKDSALWAHVEAVCRETAHLYGLLEVRTPAFERTELFSRSVGEETDIVRKEMYTFEDKGGRSMSLRPEGTAPVIRALLGAGLQTGDFHKYYYLGPMFRYERQQAGRYRQHHQFGAEIIGDPSPERDAELIDLLMTLFRRLGLSNLGLTINSIGDRPSREAYKLALRDYLSARLQNLSEDSQRRLQTNPLRILDSKDPQDGAVVAQAPSILDFLSPHCQDQFAAVQDALRRLNIPFEINNRLVRGLDYYTGTVFEVTAGELGAQNSLGGGGRYDDLISQLGGPDLPALGFGAGLERILQTMIGQAIPKPPLPPLRALFIPVGAAARNYCFSLVKGLRDEGISCDLDLLERKLKVALRQAAAREIPFVAVIGDAELQSGSCELKEMATHASKTVKLEDLAIHV
jgi:histidyl-tRNA synthetase